MKSTTKTLVLSIFMFVFAITIFSSNVVLAASENNISLVKTNESEYIVYVENLNETFKYAVSNDNTTEPTEYDISSLDVNNNNVVTIDLNTLTEGDLYLWIKKADNEVITNKIDLNDYISYDDVVNINQMTKKISVKNDDQEKTVTDSDNKTTTVITGKTVITDDNTKNYEYSLVKLPATDNQINELVSLIEQINTFENETDMYTVTTTYKNFLNMYNNIVDTIEFQKVENMEIMQPEDSYNGDRYVMLLKKLDGDVKIQDDIQVLTCKRIEDEGVDKVVNQKEVEKAVKLPITGDNLALICGFVALVIALIVLFVIKKKSNSKKNLQN